MRYTLGRESSLVARGATTTLTETTCRIAGVAALLLCWTAASAQTLPAARIAPTNSDIGVGILINQTMSAAGLEFYRDFAEFWREKPDGESYTLDILERPSKRFGNQVAVEYGQKRLFVGALPNRIDRVRALAEQAVDSVYAEIISLSIPAASGAQSDLGRDEL